MNKPGILEGTGVAMIASLASGVLGALLPLLVSQATSARILLASLALAYLIFLLKRTRERSGRIVVMASWLIVTSSVWMLDSSLLWFVLSQAATIWIIRSLYFHSSVLPALFDLGLIAFGLTAGAWAILQTGSLVMATWCFFLTQSLFGLIPHFAGSDHSPGDINAHHQDRFQSAHRVALDAVRKLSTL